MLLDVRTYTCKPGTIKKPRNYTQKWARPRRANILLVCGEAAKRVIPNNTSLSQVYQRRRREAKRGHVGRSGLDCLHPKRQAGGAGGAGK